jgi:hypothetical protein
MQNRPQRRLKWALASSFAGGLALLLGLWSWGALAAASLSATPSNPRQNDTVTLIGAGFTPGETVSVWITYPDFTVYGVAELIVNGDGSFNFPYLPDFLGASFTPTGRYTYTAFGQSSGREVYASIDVDVGRAPPSSQGVSLSAEASQIRQGGSNVFRGSGYGGGEDVALWLRYPDNSVTDLGWITAGPGGMLEYVLEMGGAPVGRYALTAYGLSSGLTGIVEFDLLVNDLTPAVGTTQFTVGPTADNQRSFASFSGSGFQPNEIVTIWVTLSDLSTLWVGDVLIGANGDFFAVLYLSEREPVGTRVYTALGNSSNLRATASYTLLPGGGPGANPLGALEADAICEGAGCQ